MIETLPTTGGSREGGPIDDGSLSTDCAPENGLATPVQAVCRASMAWPAVRLLVPTGAQSLPHVVRRRAVADDHARRRISHLHRDAGRQAVDRYNLTACINRRRHSRRRKMCRHRSCDHRCGRLAGDAVDGLRRGDLVARVQRIRQMDCCEAELRRNRDVLHAIDEDGHRRMGHEPVHVYRNGAFVCRFDGRRGQVLAGNRISLVDDDVSRAGADSRERKQSDPREACNDSREYGAERHADILPSPFVRRSYRVQRFGVGPDDKHLADPSPAGRRAGLRQQRAAATPSLRLTATRFHQKRMITQIKDARCDSAHTAPTIPPCR